jgi:hypothetical protein
MRMGMPAHLCQERSPCAVRAPPARMRAGRPRTRCNPQVRAFAGGGFWGAPACLRGARASGAHAGGTPAHPVQPSGARFRRGRFLGSPGVPARCARLRRACGRDARAPGVHLRCAPLQGQIGWQAPACHLSFQAAGRPNAPSSLCGGEGLEESHRGRFLGKPRRAIFRFGQQDAQTPPSPLVGEGGRGDEGAHAHGNARASLPGTLPLRGARASGAHGGGTPAHPAQPSGARPCRSRLVGKPRRAIFRFRQQDDQTPPAPCVGEGVGGSSQGEVFGEAPACHLLFRAAGRPDSPCSPCGSRGQGG